MAYRYAYHSDKVMVRVQLSVGAPKLYEFAERTIVPRTIRLGLIPK